MKLFFLVVHCGQREEVFRIEAETADHAESIGRSRARAVFGAWSVRSAILYEAKSLGQISLGGEP